MTQVLHEVTGKPKELVSKILEDFVDAHPGSEVGLSKVVPEAEAKQLIAKLSKEKSGILNWLLKGKAMHIDRLTSN